MQKLMICVARGDQPRESWNQHILDFCNDKLATNYRHISACIRDEQVDPAHLLAMENTGHPLDAVISLWCDNIYGMDQLLSAVNELGNNQPYIVSESNALPIDRQLGRVDGMCQIAFIRKPAEQMRREWLTTWLGSHTDIAINTQSTFGYRQNIVATALPISDSAPSTVGEWPLMDAIVEENFPTIAMTSREAFFDSEGNPELFEQRQQEMLQSCMRFIDFTAFDCVPMSQYVITL